MIDGYYHISLNGVKYRLSESAEGAHYRVSEEPLRPPNASVIQGDSSTFQLRPDLVTWRMTDFSGGMGQLRFDPATPNRWYQLVGFRVFEQPGEALPAYSLRSLLDETDVDYLLSPVMFGYFAGAPGTYLAIDGDDLDLYVYGSSLTTSLNGNQPQAGPTAITGLDDASQIAAVTVDDSALYFTQAGNNTLYSMETPPAAVVIETGAFLPVGATSLVALGPYVYLIQNLEGIVWETAKTGTGDPENILEIALSGNPTYCLTTLDGKVYCMATSVKGTTIYEIVPTSAAGPGYGRELSVLKGVLGTSIWGYGGLVYVSTEDGIFYVDPQGAYGTLGRIPGPQEVENDVLALIGTLTGKTVLGNGTTLSHFLVGEHFDGLNGGAFFEEGVGIVEIDAVSGGFAISSWAQETVWPADDQAPKLIDVFPTSTSSIAAVVRHDPSQDEGVLVTYTGQAVEVAWAVSPWHDFGVATEKILSAIRIDYSAFNAFDDETIIAIDIETSQDATAWTEDVVVITPSTQETYFVISTAAEPITFTHLRFRIRVEYDQDLTAVQLPRIRSVELQAQVPQTVRTWDLLVDLADDEGHENVSGTAKTANLLAAVDTPVNEFIDGYRSRQAGDTVTANVVVDSLQINLEKPGEGFGHVVLREVA